MIGNERYEGYYVDIVRQLAERVGFSYQLQLAADGKVGRWSKDDGWSGMLGEVSRQVGVDILGCGQ